MKMINIKFLNNISKGVATGMMLAGCLLVTPSLAQESNSGVSLLEEIVVTANRREQGIQDVSSVVQSISGDDLRDGGITEFRQIQIAVPGLSIANQEGNVELFIRGVGSANNTELGDPGAAPHLNGVYIPRPRGLGGMFYDLERVEITKGPQGTLYGRNALAGSLNILTKRPSVDETDGYFQTELLSRGGFGFEGGVNFGINDTSAVRLAAYGSNKDFGFNNVGTESLDPAGLQEDFGVRLSYINDLSERADLLVVADYSRESGTGYPGSNINSAVQESGLRPEQLNLRDVRYRGLQGDTENDIAGIQFLLGYDFDSFRLEYNGSYRTVDFRQTNAASDGIDFPGVDELQEDNFSGNFWASTSDALVQELRLVSNNDGPLQWSTGLFNITEDQEVFFFALADRGFCCFSGVEFTHPDVDSDSTAIYGDLTFNFNDTTRGIFGLRYTDESKSRFGVGGNWALVLGGSDFSCCVATRLGTEGFVPTGLDRTNFDLSQIDTPQEQANFLLEGIQTPGARDTLTQQVAAVANGAEQGECFVRPDIDNGFVTCPENGLFSFTNLTIPGQQVGDSSDSYGDFRIGIEHDLSDDHMIYAKLSSGTKAGGFNDSFEGLVPESFDPENILSYEIGSRLSFQAFGQPAIFNSTLFYYDYSDQVFQDLTCINFDEGEQECNGFALVNRNVGKSELLGLELEGHFSFENQLSLDIYATFLDSEILEGTVADSREQDFGAGGITPLIDLTGNRLPLQSDLEITASLGQQISLGEGMFDWNVLAKYRSEYFLTQFNERDINLLSGEVRSAIEIGQASLQEAATTINVGVGYTFPGDRYRVELYGQNVTDEVISQKAIVGAGNDIRFLNDARTYGLLLRANF